MQGIEIEISIYTDDEIALRDLGLKTEEKNVVWEKRTFWKIDYAFVNKEDSKYTNFWVSGEGFICNIKYNDFVELFNTLKQ